MAEAAQPAHLWIAPNHRTLYAVNWETDGAVSSYHIDPKSGALAFLNKTSSHGALPNQVVVDPSGRVAVTVNFASGSLAAYKPVSYTHLDVYKRQIQAKLRWK